MLIAAVGMLGFGVYHWYFIAPVTAVFLEGALWIVAIGALVGWAYRRSFLDRGRSGARAGLLYGALFASTLVPFELVGLVWGPFPSVESPGDILPLLPIAFLGVPLAIVIAWFLADRKGVAWSFVLAVAVGHFIVGGSIANFGGTGVSFLIFIGFVLLELLGGLILGVASTPAPLDDAEPVPVKTLV